LSAADLPLTCRCGKKTVCECSAIEAALAWIEEHPVGNALPSSRTVAEGAKVSRGTAATALKQLSNDWTVPRTGKDGKTRRLPKTVLKPKAPFKPKAPTAQYARYVWLSLRKYRIEILTIEPSAILAIMDSKMLMETRVLAPRVSKWLEQLGDAALDAKILANTTPVPERPI
jgi:hypothetical protein